MNLLSMGEVVKRGTVLYVRVTDENKEFAEKFADHLGVSTSNLINNLLNEIRASTKLPRKKRNDSTKVHAQRRTQEA